MEKTQGIRYSHAGQPIEATGASLCPYSATVYAQFCSFKDEPIAGTMHCDHELGGLLKHYHRRAA